MRSPPKRLTRARAATKEPAAASSTSSASRPAKTVTAAAKARAPISSSLTASTASTAAKRKTRSDDAEEEQRQASQVKRPRGRPPKNPVGGVHKAVAMAAPAPAPMTTSKAAEPVRGARAKPAPAAAAASAAKEESTAPKPTRGRPRKVDSKPAVTVSQPEPVKRGRGRPPTVMKPATSTTTAANKPPVKKMVTFREPDKENMEPAAAPKEPPPAGMRGRPARRGGAAAARPGRPATKAPKPQAGDKKPLSPKKITQLILSRTDSADESEDELALEKVSAKPLAKSPIKPPSKKSEPIPAETEPVDTDIAVNAMTFDMPEMSTTLFASPARRPTSPPRDTIKSPAKRIAVPLPGSALKLSSDAVAHTPFKSSASTLLQSAAKRPQSPMKPFVFSAQKERPGESSTTKPSMLHSPAKRAMPGFKPVLSAHRGLPTLDETPAGTPTRAAKSSTKLLMEDEAQEDDEEEEPFEGPIEFPGLSSPPSAEPSSEAGPVATKAEEEEEEGEEEAEPQPNPRFSQLRQKDLDPCHDMSSISDSEDDTLPFERVTATPSISGERTTRGRASRSPVRQSRRSTLGFGALSDQLGTWSAASPVKSARSFVVENEPEDAEGEGLGHEVEASNQDTPMKNAFSKSEMSEMEDAEDQQLDEEAIITDEDMALAQEANEMSLMDPKEEDDASNTRHSFDDGLSDASQEYGDENQVPVESPTPSAAPRAPPPVTPVSRPVTRSFNTTTKVPLKAADNSTPSPLKKKSLSTPRAAPKRSSQPKRAAPVLAHTPEKPRRRSSRNIGTISEEPEQPKQTAEEPSTPEAKVDLWASIGTPGRTPRRDLNPNLLRGAIVFVDVHTSEGADASGIFVEVLTQMGARCPQKWNWNPSNASNSESTKVGITHVVFKDGSKRTLEKVREAKGVVQCVGVSWVLDCERDNKWLDEAPYSIDTSNVPRGGARRRKSMEPKTVSNKDGSAVSSSSKERRESASSTSSTKTPNRRQSSIWVHTPSDPGDEEQEEEDIEWSNMILTPVPKTPAPETIMKFATETPSNLEDDEDDEEDGSPTREELLTRTCPPKAQKYLELGGGILSRPKDSDENVMQRLMAARRKSLQFAPKVGSPLAKMWQ
ncbi:hypothetical protein CCMA1212_005108 [Trichoderma ghanense]|uniref:BRCT domain-containing protein n=1 Tax=Trichoderma ghanense TaxID=65468 RepID=A0ABY2H6Z5_9HYPO